MSRAELGHSIQGKEVIHNHDRQLESRRKIFAEVPVSDGYPLFEGGCFRFWRQQGGVEKLRQRQLHGNELRSYGAGRYDV